MCGEYLLDGDIGSPEPAVGEAAHIKGKRRNTDSNAPKHGSKSARHEFLLPDEDADDPDNVVLLCRLHHSQIDAEVNAGTLDVGLLRRVKRLHEQRIRRAAEMAMSDRTVVVRVIGDLYGDTVQCTRLEATGACLRRGGRLPEFALALDHSTIECDLRGLPGEQAGTQSYFDMACAAINELVESRLRDGVSRGHIGHVSVFGFARLPLLVYLGTKLDDGFSVQLFQRSRLTQSWDWGTGEGTATFVVCSPEPSNTATVNVIVNASGSIEHRELPEELQHLPTYVLRAGEGTVADANVLVTGNDLNRFQAACYELLGTIEAKHKSATKIHLFAAAPLSAAISLGQAINPQVSRSIGIYHRTDDGYEACVRA